MWRNSWEIKDVFIKGYLGTVQDKLLKCVQNTNFSSTTYIVLSSLLSHLKAGRRVGGDSRQFFPRNTVLQTLSIGHRHYVVCDRVWPCFISVSHQHGLRVMFWWWICDTKVRFKCVTIWVTLHDDSVSRSVTQVWPMTPLRVCIPWGLPVLASSVGDSL